MTRWNEDRQMKKRTKEDKRGQKDEMMKWWCTTSYRQEGVAVQVWISLCLTLQPPWLDIELSEQNLTMSDQQWIIPL
jgi:hypothetical protein